MREFIQVTLRSRIGFVQCGIKRAQEKTQFDVKGHVNPCQASGDRLQSKEDHDLTNVQSLREPSLVRMWLRTEH